MLGKKEAIPEKKAEMGGFEFLASASPLASDEPCTHGADSKLSRW